MSRTDEIDKIDRALKDAEIRLKSIQTAVENIDKEIATLSPRKLELEQNIEFHKKTDTIPIAHEYKKTKAELSKTTARLILIVADQKRAVQACKDIQSIMEKFRSDHAKLLKVSENNVLRPDFGGDNGKK